MKIFLAKNGGIAFITEKDFAKAERAHRLFIQTKAYPFSQLNSAPLGKSTTSQEFLWPNTNIKGAQGNGTL